MKIRLSAAAAVAVACGIVAQASGPIAVYAKVDRVVMEPNEQAPDRIQVWGAFSIAKESNGNGYAAPARGYLYYQLPPVNPNIHEPDLDQRTARNEWKDLKTVAGTSQIIALGSPWCKGCIPRLRTSEQPPANPDPYTLNVGIRTINAATSTFAPIVALRDFKP